MRTFYLQRNIFLVRDNETDEIIALYWWIGSGKVRGLDLKAYNFEILADTLKDFMLRIGCTEEEAEHFMKTWEKI